MKVGTLGRSVKTQNPGYRLGDSDVLCLGGAWVFAQVPHMLMMGLLLRPCLGRCFPKSDISLSLVTVVKTLLEP